MNALTSRVALAGFGAWGRMHARALGAIDGTSIVSVYCHGEASEKAAMEYLPQARRFRDYGKMLSAGGFDVVDVTVPNYMHARFAVAALEAGAHVLLEKPLGLTLAECEAVMEAARRAGKLIAVNHELRASHQWAPVRDMAARGDFGQIRYQHFSLFRHKFRQGSGGWRYDPTKVGSWVLEELVHFFDLVLWYAAENGRPAAVRAFGNGVRGSLIDNFTVVLEWEDGSLAVVNQCLSGFEHHTVFELAGEIGSLRTWWSGARDRTLHPEFALKFQRAGSEPESIAIPQSGEVFELQENLRHALTGFREGRSTLAPEEAARAVEICLAAVEAFMTGERVVLSRPA